MLVEHSTLRQKSYILFKFLQGITATKEHYILKHIIGLGKTD